MNDNTAFYRRLPDPAIGDRFRGCLLGGAVGDALGAPVEFLRLDEILAHFGSRGITRLVPAHGRLGAITDDTQMTLFTAEGVLRGYVRGKLKGLCHPPSVIHQAYFRWLHTQGGLDAVRRQGLLDGWLIQQDALYARRAPGATCLSALKAPVRLGEAARNASKGCGGVMRVAPIGMFFQALAAKSPGARDRFLVEAFDLGCAAAGLTHGHPTGQLTAGVMAAIVFQLLEGVSLVAAIDTAWAMLTGKPEHAETASAIDRAMALANESMSPRQAIVQLGEGWIAEEALAIGIYCALVAADFESGVILAVNHDGDSDSTGLIAGHLLGAIHRVRAIPSHWLEPLELRQVIEEVADDLATVGQWRLDGDQEPATASEAEYYLARYPGH